MATAKAGTNWFAVGITIAVVVVLVALGGVVVWLNNQATAPGAQPSGGAFDEKTGSIVFGEGDRTVTTYVDFMCPGCGAFEAQYGQSLQQAAADDTITLEIRPVGMLDRYSQGTEYSSRAASAMYCVASEAPDSALTFFNLLFENRPEENTPGLSDEQILGFAKEAGAGDAASCIEDGTYKKFAQDQVSTMPADEQGRVVTPTVLLDGERLESSSIASTFAEILK